MRKVKNKIIIAMFGLIILGTLIVYILPFMHPLTIKGIFSSYKYIVYGDHVEIIRYLGNDDEVSIPETLFGHKVTVLGEGCFRRTQNIRSVYIPDSIKELESEVFAYCTNLESVQLSKELEYIPERCFAYCYALTNIDIPSNVKVIQGAAFYNCKTLVNIDIPLNVEEIRDSAFANCCALKEVEIPETTCLLDSAAFYDCVNLEKVTIPKSVKKISKSTFEGTPWLETLIDICIEEDAKKSVIDHTFVTAGADVLIYFIGVQGENVCVDIPEGVKCIGGGVFNVGWVLSETGVVIREIVVPESVVEIGNSAVGNRKYIEYVVLKNPEVILDESAIWKCPNVTIVSAEGSTGQKYAEENGLKWMDLAEWED